MKINPLIEIEDMDGQPIPAAPDSKENFTLKTTCVNALYAQFEDEKNLSGEDKVKRYNLAEKIYNAKGEIDISAEDITLVKKLIGKAYGALIVGRAYELLDPMEDKGDTKMQKGEKGKR